MTRSKRPAEAAGPHTEQLAEAVNKLADQLQVLREALDDFRQIFKWAVQNDKLRCPEHEQHHDGASAVPVVVRSELEEGQHEAIAELIQESLSDVAGDLEEVVREQLKQELAGFRDVVDQFSLDIQWAARQVRQATSDHRAAPSECRAEELASEDATPPHRPDPESKPTNPPEQHNSSTATRQQFLWQPE